MENKKHYYVYVLLCNNGSFYCGFSIDVVKRFKKHLSGKGAKYTRSHKPIIILCKWRYGTKSRALKKEYAFKQLNRHKKILKMIQSGVNVKYFLKKYGFK